MSGDTWYKRSPRDFLDGVQGMGPELIGAYSIIIDIIYARGGDMPRDDRHLAGVMGCSVRKARALTDGLLGLGKIRLDGVQIVNERASAELEKRRNQRETGVKPARTEAENGAASNVIKPLALQNRIEKSNTPLTPLQGGRGRRFGVPENVKRMLGE